MQKVINALSHLKIKRSKHSFRALHKGSFALLMLGSLSHCARSCSMSL